MTMPSAQKLTSHHSHLFFYSIHLLDYVLEPIFWITTKLELIILVIWLKIEELSLVTNSLPTCPDYYSIYPSSFY